MHSARTDAGRKRLAARVCCPPELASQALSLAGIGTLILRSNGAAEPDERARTLLGLDRSPDPRLLLRLTDPKVRQPLIRAVRAALAGAPASLPASGQSAGGQTLHLDLALAPVRGADGMPALLVTLADRTVERSELAQLHHRIENFRCTLDLSPQLHWVADKDAGITRIGERYLAMTGQTKEEALGLHGWMDIVHPEDMERVQGAVNVAFAHGRPLDVRCRFRIANGSFRWMRSRAYPRRDGDGAIIRWYGYIEDIHDTVLAEIETRWAAEHDPLTGLPNRALFNKRLDDVIARASDNLSRVGLIMLDLDHFKDVNDIFGHDAGDRLLKQFARILRETIHVEATIARLGGDEFAILLPDLPSPTLMEELAEALFAQLKMPLKLDGRDFDCRSSAGAAIFPTYASNASELFKHADIALYEAKNAGRGKYVCFEPTMKNAMQRRVAMINIGRESVDSGQILPYYQPQFALDTGALLGFEALLRRRDRSGQICLPETIAEAFNDYEVAEAIGIAMLDTIVADMIAWRDRGLDCGRMSINASAAEFRNRDFIHRLVDHADGAGIARDRFVIEVTEGVFVGRSGPLAAEMIFELKHAGFGIALDDFGTGYASLTHLRDIPVDSLKIDRSFIMDLFRENGGDSAAIVSAIIKLGQSLGMTVVAEGVETRRQALFLKRNGCMAGQGFLFGRPAPKAVIDELLAGARRIA